MILSNGSPPPGVWDRKSTDHAGKGNLQKTSPIHTVIFGTIKGKVPWSKIDDNFYFAQGVGYALYHILRAIRVEFAAVLQDKNATVIMHDIIASLEEAYFEPVIITNGSKDGVFANHSNNLRVFLDDARQKGNSLIRMLDQG